jgi:hypothetical protein
MDVSLFCLGRPMIEARVRNNGTNASSSSVPTHQQSPVPTPLVSIYRRRFEFCPQLCTFHLLFLHCPQIAETSAAFSLIQPITLSLPTLSLLQRMAFNDNNDKCKLEEDAESLVARKRLRLSNDDVGDNDSSDSPKEDTKEEEDE